MAPPLLCSSQWMVKEDGRIEYKVCELCKWGVLHVLLASCFKPEAHNEKGKVREIISGQ